MTERLIEDVELLTSDRLKAEFDSQLLGAKEMLRIGRNQTVDFEQRMAVIGCAQAHATLAQAIAARLETLSEEEFHTGDSENEDDGAEDSTEGEDLVISPEGSLINFDHSPVSSTAQ